MTNNPEASVDTLRDRIQHSDEISEEDREKLMAFSDRLFLLKSEYSIQRHEKLLRHVTIAAEEVGGLAAALDDREAAEDIVQWINRTYDNEETNKDYRIALRVFAKRVTDGGEVPDSVDWVPSSTSNDYSLKPDPAEMLRWEEDVKPMLNATMNTRDAALIAVAWDSGARSGELLDLTVGNVSDHTHGLQITVDGKKGQRSVPLVTSVPYLQQWLRDHPARDDPEAPLWCKLQSGDSMSYQMKRKAVRQAAERAGIDSPVTFTNFRKSSASHLASRGVNQAAIEDHHGWKRGSDVAARYVSVFGEDGDREIAKAHGVDVEEKEPDPIGPITCPRCDKETPRDEDFCVWCNQALDYDAVETVKERQRNVRDSILRLAQEDPELIDTSQKLGDLVAVAEENPDLLDDAERLIAALEGGD